MKLNKGEVMKSKGEATSTSRTQSYLRIRRPKKMKSRT